ncbi:helix-turn-helix transcriptional regulator [Brasilonema sp. CT11]|nr:helix-turn-helix transcriptional regulator [Brasilonema sp. CT11]
MAFKTPKRIGTHNLESVQRSLIKPNLLNLSGSGSMLNGVIIERNLDVPNVEFNNTSAKAAKHVIVVHSRSSASLEWKIDGSHKTSLFSAGDTVINPAGLFVAPRWSAEVEILLLGIDPVFMTRIAEQMNRHSGLELIPRFQFRDELLRSLALNLIAEFEQDIPPDPVYAEFLTHTLIAHLIRWYSVAGSKPLPANKGLSVSKVALVKDYINEHLSEVLSLEVLATVVDLSPSHFMTLFKLSTGLAPHQYVIAQRIEKAKALLTQTRLSISDIASQTGFADQSHLTRLMRRHTGLTPKALRGG